MMQRRILMNISINFTNVSCSFAILIVFIETLKILFIVVLQCYRKLHLFQ